jgi:hypothetical protein
MAVVAHSGSVFGRNLVSSDEISSGKFTKSWKGAFREVAPARVRAVSFAGKHDPAEFQLLASTQEGLNIGLEPISVEDCSGGVYIFKDEKKHLTSVFKPAEEEPHASSNPKGYQSSLAQLKYGVSAGEGAIREVAAYVLDSNTLGYSGIPATIMAEFVHPKFAHLACGEGVLGSLQMYKQNMGSSDDFGCSMFLVEEVHKIGVLDVRIANLDRHGGNVLVGKSAKGLLTLTPIDHAYSFPAWNSLQDVTFEWLNWPQSHQNFSEGTKAIIRRMNVSYDAFTLQKLALPAASIATLRITTLFLKTAAEHLTLFQIGSAMVREVEDKASVFEGLLKAACENSGATPVCDSAGKFYRCLQTTFDDWVKGERKN